MDVTIQLRKLGRDASRRAELREYCKLNMEAILQVLPDRLLCSEGPDLLDCLLNGIPDSPSSLSNKTKVLDIVLRCLRSEATSLSLCGQLLSRIRLELPRAPLADLVQRAEDSVHSLVHDDDANMTWRDILPECLSVLSERGRLVHCGTEMSAEEYKAQCVRALCQCRWQERCVVQLAAMFTDIVLDREAHGQVVTKLCTVLLELPPDSVPPLLLQLLKLCKNHHLETVLAYLSRYFNTKLYGRLSSPLHDSDSTCMDVEEFGGHTPSELTECVSTCVYHAVSTAPEQLLKALKGWPRARLLRSPLLLEASLALAACASRRAASLAPARAALQQHAIDAQRRRQSAWLRALLAADVDVTRVLKVIIAESTNHRQLTTSGLMELAFSLLSVSPMLGRERTALQCWSHAELILVRLARAQPETAPHILSRLADRLSGAAAQRQCAECLLVLCKLCPLALERCTQLCSIIENCQASNGEYHGAAAVLDAVHPVLQFSSRVRDTLVMVCRKGLLSRDSASRCLALWGFLGLLRHMRVPAGGAAGGSAGADSCSDQYSVNSYLTQISIDLHSTQLGGGVSNVRNEAVCREVISILRRCFHQDAAVKQLLYANIFSCARQKVSLHESILELLYDHLIRYISEEGAVDLGKCVQLTATGATLTEPIGYLLLAAQHFVAAPAAADSEDALAEEGASPGADHYRRRLLALMERLCENYRSYTLANFHMEGEHGLSDLTPESKAKCLRIQQALQLYEALMSHRLLQWSPESDAPAPKLYALFSLHSQLLQHAKTPSKLTKKGIKASLNETGNTTQKTQKSQKTTKSPKGGKKKDKAPMKLSTLTKDKAAPFKPLSCLWDLGICCRALELLYSEEVAWSTAEQRAQIRTRRDFHQFVLGNLQSALAADTLRRRSELVAHCTCAARVLYARCVSRFQDMCDFHEPTALASLDAFRECLVVATSSQHRFNILSFLQQVSQTEGSSAECVAAVLRCVLSGLQQLDSELEEGDAAPDAMSRRLSAALMQLASLAVDKLPADTDDNLDADNEDSGETECEMFPSIDEASGQAVHGHVCGHMAALCAHVDHVLQRARELDTAARYVTHHEHDKLQKELTELDKSAVVLLCQIGDRVAKLAALRCTVGAGSDRALQAAVRLYSPLTALVTRLQRSPASYIHTIRLERALAACGRRLSEALDGLVMYVESSQAAAGRERVLRDTRLVPRLVFAAEQFGKHVILLAGKTKLNLQQHLSLGTARDFRIKAAVLAEALRGQAGAAGDDVDDDASTVELSAAGAGGMEVEEETGEAAAGEAREEAVPSSKRRRLSAR